ncbi:hypothetical protein [Oscillatoria salina]|uniref:hypothetical protein n=1 Tax=Oscillatoria salina TaxID=331517 RepID=UPI0013BE6E3E|nr:hypothetical protein [Oscillatoria salina]MBZ8181668.1 hypothetical protein [Oscillatoria salina IIICB1]NET90173.1 hypothetical protein [Kamptonema sp. SIO1D9]
MNQRNLFVLTVYLLCVAYVIYKMVKDVNEYISVKLDREALDAELEEKNLKDLLSISFKLEDRIKPPNFKLIPIKITNKSGQHTFIVDWEQSTIADQEGRSQRLIRLIPGMTMDLSQPQVTRVVAPGQILEEKVTSEETLKGIPGEALAIVSPLFDPKKMQAATAEKPVKFSLRLIIQQAEPLDRLGQRRLYTIICQFTIKSPPWYKSLAWKSKDKKKKKK